MGEVEVNTPWSGTPGIDVRANSRTASMSNRPNIKMKTHPTISNDTALIKMIRIMPFVLSAVCAGAAIANLIG
jgi:hypothetical protein